MIFLLYIDKKQKSVFFFNEIDNEGRCLKQLHSQTRSIVFEKGGGQTHPKFLDKEKKPAKFVKILIPG